MNVLHLEDDDETAAALEMLFQHAGIRSVHAGTGREALAIYRTCRIHDDIRPDVLLLDLMLPDMTLAQVLESMKKEGRVPPVVIYSAAPAEVLDTVREQVGASVALRKPFDAPHLLQALDQATRSVAGPAAG